MKTSNFLIIIVFCFIAFACEKQEGTTQQISKIETFYTGIGPKDESKYIDNSPASTLSEKELEIYMAGIRKRSELEKPTYELKSSGGTVGVIKSGSCGSYQTFEVYLDNEDGYLSNLSQIGGWTGECTMSNNNPHLKFCLVPDNFTTVVGNYAVLRTSVHTSLHYIDKYFDCEDNSNASWCKLGSTVYNTNFNVWGGGTTAVTKMNGGNFEMYCDYYSSTLNPTTNKTFPDFGISYGVLGTIVAPSPIVYLTGTIRTQDEKTNNGSWCHMDQLGSYGVDGVIAWSGGPNNQTALTFAKVK